MPSFARWRSRSLTASLGASPRPRTSSRRRSCASTKRSRARRESSRLAREQYAGEWLPEPLLEDPVPGGAEHAETSDSLSLAFLVLLETLSPVQRAVFLLHDVFDYDYAEVSAIVGKSEENCRQLAVRARRHVDRRRPRFEASREQREELAQRFFDAVESGDTEGLLSLLAPTPRCTATAAEMHPHGREQSSAATRLRACWQPRGCRSTVYRFRRRSVQVNGQPGAVFLDADGRLINVMALDIVDGVVQTVRSIINPEKLRHLGELADVRALLRAQRLINNVEGILDADLHIGSAGLLRGGALVSQADR
jgi:RNA polymerase sigma-70 factor, ECF subfamily